MTLRHVYSVQNVPSDLSWGMGEACILYMDLEVYPIQCSFSYPGNSRGLVHGRLWRRDGVLAVTCAQEGVFRVREDTPQSKL